MDAGGRAFRDPPGILSAFTGDLLQKETVYGAYVLSEARQEPEVSGTIKIYHRIRDKAAGAELARSGYCVEKVQHRQAYSRQQN